MSADGDFMRAARAEAAALVKAVDDNIDKQDESIEALVDHFEQAAANMRQHLADRDRWLWGG